MKFGLFFFSLLCVLNGVLCFITERNLVQDECGVEVGDNPLHRDPWVVYLEYYRHGRERDFKCAGSLVSSRHVITAAHCIEVRYTRLTARFGEYDATAEVDCVDDVCADPPISIDVANVSKHPNHHFLENDLAILTLADEVPYTDFIRPVCLPSTDHPNDAVFTASGWGMCPVSRQYSSVKKHLALPLWTNKTKCNRTLKDTLPDTVMCAGGVRNVDTCWGDSGGPLTLKNVKNKLRHELFGVTCAGNSNCGIEGVPGIYTIVKDHLNWINSIVKI